MMLYRYLKKEPLPLKLKKSKIPRTKIVSFVLVFLGLGLIAYAAYPIISYQLFLAPKFANNFLSPTIEAEMAQSFFVPQTLGAEIKLLDLTNASNWFPELENSSAMEEIGEKGETYSLSIPKLKIDNAQVLVAGQDLKKNLIHYPGTAYPGRFGNTVIFGHSVLPQFFNPKNYMTIFSTLPTLNPRDEIIIYFNKVKYQYVVEKMIEVPPSDISILAQRYDDSYLTLITCVPPGTYLKRLIVRARLAKI